MSRKSNNAPTTNSDATNKSDFAQCLTQFLANNHPKKALGDHIGLVNQAQFNLIFDELEKRKHRSTPIGHKHQNSGNPPHKVLEVQSSDLFSEEEFDGRTNSKNATITGAGNMDEDDDDQSSKNPRRMRLNCEIDTIPGSGVNLDAVTSVNKLVGLELKNN